MAARPLADLDAHEPPPAALRAAWKTLSRLPGPPDPCLVDDPRLSPPDASGAGFRRAGTVARDRLARAFAHLRPGLAAEAGADAEVLCHPLVPGLLVLPALLPPPVQAVLLDKVLHRDLANPLHQTNLHLHYDVPYPGTDVDASDAAPGRDADPESGADVAASDANVDASDADVDASASGPDPDSDSDSAPDYATARSLFSLPPSPPALFRPKDAAIHAPLSARQALSRRLHWLTLGGQYDWSGRVYPPGPPPPFPPDLARFLGALFPETRPQAAIVNVYGAGDSMMVHRDVSEEVDRGLVSISLGCDALFLIAPGGENGDDGDDAQADAAQADAASSNKADAVSSTDDDATATANDDPPRRPGHPLLRLRSGDALYMTRAARAAWHGVPKILADTCPRHLEAWPARPDGRFGPWRGWMRGKRVNLNVRQMTD